MSRYEITPEQTRALQERSLKMAVFFDEFCQKNDLTWFLCGGCCIGAVRNAGFIPWDDDIDGFMPREDYERLKRIWKDTPEYSIQYSTKEKQTQNPFLTICDNHTTFIKTYQKDLDINHGIMLDILPLDGAPTGFARKLQKLHALLYSLFLVGKAPQNHGRAVCTIAKILLAFVPRASWRYRIWRYCERKMSRYRIGECEFITELCSGPGYMQNEYPKSCFDKVIRMRFEDVTMPMPAGYDTYLRMAFGDYQKLPPKEKRVCHHEYEVLDTENSYLKYRGQYYFVKGERQ